jgi:hypothetical protein
MPRILATECVSAPAIASNLFIEVANTAAVCFYLDAPCFFAATVFFFSALCEDLFVVEFAALTALFASAPALPVALTFPFALASPCALDPVFVLASACVLAFPCAPFARTWEAGARRTGSATASVR